MYELFLNEIPEDSGLINFNGRWSDFWFPTLGTTAKKSASAGDELVLETSDAQFGILLHRHPWSGVVTCEYDGEESEIDLYNDSPDYMYWLDFNNPERRDRRVIIRNTGRSNPVSRSIEWFVLAVRLSERPAWQQRLINVSQSIQLVRGERGTFLTLAMDTIISKTMVLEGVWARKDVELFDSLVKPGMTVGDLGANLGHHTVVFSELVGPRGFVIAVEAQRVLCDLLRVNLLINRCTNTVVEQVALGEKAGEIVLNPVDYGQYTNFGSIGRDYSAERKDGVSGEHVQLVTFDAMMARPFYAGRKFDFLKIDTQSSELFILQGARSILSKQRPQIFLEISPLQMKNAGYDYREVYAILKKYGYGIRHVHDDTEHPGGIRAWNGTGAEEWDILALPS